MKNSAKGDVGELRRNRIGGCVSKVLKLQTIALLFHFHDGLQKLGSVQFDHCQVEARTKHFWRTLPPSSFLAVNRREWEEMHDRLNGGVPVPKERTKTSAICCWFFGFSFRSYWCQPSVDTLQFWVGQQDVQFGSGAAAALLL